LDFRFGISDFNSKSQNRFAKLHCQLVPITSDTRDHHVRRRFALILAPGVVPGAVGVIVGYSAYLI